LELGVEAGAAAPDDRFGQEGKAQGGKPGDAHVPLAAADGEDGHD
jgi:hypothetical protein